MVSTEKITNFAPNDQLTSVHQVADRLFPAYTVDEGHAYLAGCTLDNRLFMRVTANLADGAKSFFIDASGRRLDAGIVNQLGMEDTYKLAKSPERAEAGIARLAEFAQRLAEDEFAGLAADGTIPQVELAALWCKYAQGKLRFSIGERSVDLPFSDWAATLVPPPFVCRYTGEKTFHLAATSDGRIVAAEQIATCAQSGLRLLRHDLVICTVSGKLVSRDLSEVCPVTDKHVLSEEMVECESCRQRVSPKCVESNRCLACRRPQRVSKDDPRLASLLDAHPAARKWRRWTLAETAGVFIFNGSGMLKQIRLVLDKDTLEPKHLAARNRFSAAFKDVEPQRLAEVLGK